MERCDTKTMNRLGLTNLFLNAVIRSSESNLQTVKRCMSDDRHFKTGHLLNLAAQRKTLRHRLLPKLKPHLAIVGAPLVYGQPLSGTDAAPGLLRSSQLITRLVSKGAEVVDHGDLDFEIVANDVEIVPGCKYARTVGLATQKISDKIEAILEDDKLCLLLGGDHSVSIGSVCGHIRVHPDAAIIWVDAHPDINTPLTSPSGNIHGMVLSFLMKELPHERVPGLEWCKPCLSADQIGYIGLRSIDPGEREVINKYNICAFEMTDVRTLGVTEVMRQMLLRIDPQGNRPLHLSLDVDALDPYHIPATGTPVADGLTLREALKIARTVHHTGWKLFTKPAKHVHATMNYRLDPDLSRRGVSSDA